jgi:hypothetical protein
MRKTKSLFFVSFLLFIIAGSTSSIATSTQWFPSEGTISDYAISHTLYFLNGTIVESNKFDLYYNLDYYAIPSILKQYFTPVDWSLLESVANGSTLTYRHSYTEHSGTQWKRAKDIRWGNGSDSDKSLSLYYFEDDVYSAWFTLSGAFDTVDKNNFWTTMASGSLLDYWDSTLGIGSTIYNDFYPIVGITSEIIIALTQGVSYNTTFIAGRDGRVRTRISGLRSLTLENKGLKAVTLTFSLVEPESSLGIPSFPIALTVLGLLVGVLIIMRGSKRKLTHKFKQQ